MSYNGIGLSTPRGSGTSGHIQANRSNLRRGPRDNFSRDKAADFNDPAGGASAYRAPDQSILEHERKRRIEAQCFELQVQLEDEGLLSAEDVEAQVSALREKLTAEGAGQKQGHIKGHERHELAAAKQKADENLRRALGIKADHVEGLAFNREYQEEQKRVRIAQKEERAKLEVQLKADRERAIREREEQRKRHDDDMARERRMQQDELARGRREHEQRMRDIDRNGLPYDDRRSRSPVRRRDDSRSLSPPPRSRRRYSDSRSPSPRRSASPPPRRRGRSPTRSMSPRRDSRSRSPRRRSYSRSHSRSRSPPRRRARRDSPSRSRSRSRSPPPRGGRDRSRSRSMSMSRSPSPPRRDSRGRD